MAVLTIEQIAQTAVNAGFNSSDTDNLVLCVSIALAESGGKTDAVNVANSNGTTDKGVWQINTVHDEKLPGADRMDPNVNAKLMMTISSNGSNWQPWSTFNNGAYNKHTGAVSMALTGKTFQPGAGIPVGGTPVSAGDDADSTTISTFFKVLTDGNFWKRFLFVLAGIGMTVMGIVALMVSTGAAGKVANLIPSKKLATTAIKAVA